MSGSARLRRSGNPSCSTTRIAPSQTATESWHRRFWNMHRKALGRGLDALIPVSSPTATEELAPGVRELPISEIGPNPFQPRTRFDDDAIRELAASIKSSGMLQPVVVRRDPGGGYQLVAGERRLRAAGFAGLTRIPAIVREGGDEHMLEFALIENI